MCLWEGYKRARPCVFKPPWTIEFFNHRRKFLTYPLQDSEVVIIVMCSVTYRSVNEFFCSAINALLSLLREEKRKDISVIIKFYLVILFVRFFVCKKS
jgi:hypothetical protein